MTFASPFPFSPNLCLLQALLLLLIDAIDMFCETTVVVVGQCWVLFRNPVLVVIKLYCCLLCCLNILSFTLMIVDC